MDEQLTRKLSDATYRLERAGRYLSAASQMRDALRQLDLPGHTLTLSLNLYGADFELATEEAKAVIGMFLEQADGKRSEYDRALADVKELAAQVEDSE